MGETFPKLRLRVMELGKPTWMTAPVKSATIDDNAAYRGTMAADPFGGRVNDDVDAMFDGTTEVSSTAKGIIALKPLVHILQSEFGFNLTINGIPLAWQTSESALKSRITLPGLLMLSTQTNLVFPSMAAAKSTGF